MVAPSWILLPLIRKEETQGQEKELGKIFWDQA